MTEFAQSLKGEVAAHLSLSSNAPAGPPPAPTKTKRSRRRRLPVYLRPQELERLIAEAPTPRDRLIILIGAYAGLRVSEIVELQVGHVDFEEALLEVHAGKGDKDRNLPMHERIAWDLHQYLGERRDGWLFPSERSGSGHLTTRAVQLMIKDAAGRAQIARVVTPHKLRHTFATQLLAHDTNLLEIKDLLGHSSVATTQIYAAALPERLRGAVDRL